MSETHHGLQPDQRTRLAALADVLITGGQGLPSASKADVHRKWIDRTFAARPDLHEPVIKALVGDDDPAVTINRLREHDWPVFDAFSFAVAGAYFMNPSVCKKLGMPGNAPKPKAALVDEADYYLEGDLLAEVIRRGPTYRPTPTARCLVLNKGSM